MIDLSLIRRWVPLLAVGAMATLSGCGAPAPSFNPMMASSGMAPIVARGPVTVYLNDMSALMGGVGGPLGVHVMLRATPVQVPAGDSSATDS
jgi:hypothetical protein